MRQTNYLPIILLLHTTTISNSTPLHLNTVFHSPNCPHLMIHGGTIFFLTTAWNFIETLVPSSHLSSPCSAGWFFPQNFSLNRINGYLFSLPLSSLIRTIQIAITYTFSHLPWGLLTENPLPSCSTYSASITLHLPALTSPPQRNLSCPLWLCKIHALL